jgi:hypothetical protein
LWKVHTLVKKSKCKCNKDKTITEIPNLLFRGEKIKERKFHRRYIGLVRETKPKCEREENGEKEIINNEKRKSKREYDDHYII